jgi:PatG C-terminal
MESMEGTDEAGNQQAEVALDNNSPAIDEQVESIVPDERGGMPLAPEEAPASFVYALGRVEPRFPSMSVEKEFAQVLGRDGAEGLTDRQALHSVLSERENRYLARQLCWVFAIGGLETYVVLPRDPVDLDLLIDAIRPVPSPSDIDVIIGVRGPIAEPQMCNGLTVPIVGFDKLYSFERDELLGAIPRPESVEANEEQQFRAVAADLFDRLIQISDNTGATDEHRAVNYLAVRYPRIYAHAAEELARDSSLTSVVVRQSPLSGPRNIVDVIFAYTNRRTDVTEKFYVRVDVTHEFPFLIVKLSPYFDR